MGAESRYTKAIAIGVGVGGVLLLTSSVETHAKVTPVKPPNEQTGYSKSFEQEVLDQARLPATLATATPYPIPTLARPRMPQVVPTSVPRAQEPSGIKDGAPRPVPSNVQADRQEATPVPTVGTQTIDMQTGPVFGPPFIPEKQPITMVAESFAFHPLTVGGAILTAAAFGFAGGVVVGRRSKP